MKMIIKFKARSVYGIEQLYPACETGEKFLKALNLKTFTPSVIKALQALDISFEQVNDSKVDLTKKVSE